MDADLHRARLNPKQVCDVLMPHTLISSEHDQLPFIDREHEECSLEAGQFATLLQSFDGSWTGRGRLEVAGGQRIGRPTRSEVIRAGIPRNPEEPRLETGTLAISLAV